MTSSLEVLVKDFLAIWGACLSTALGLLKLYEHWRDRFRLDVSCNLMDASHGNEILIRNLSSRPAILANWDLFYRSGRWPNYKDEGIEAAEYDWSDRKIDPHETLKLRFAEEKYFGWRCKTLNGRRIYIRLHLAGRRTQCRLVYPK